MPFPSRYSVILVAALLLPMATLSSQASQRRPIAPTPARVSTLPAARTAAPDSSAAAMAARDTVRVLLSASGGIAKGAYQGGVNWVIMEFMRRHRMRSFRDALALDSSAPPYELEAVTGASAGNINALMTAIAWCTDSVRLEDGRWSQHIPAEKSLFWRMWVNTGISEIMPELTKRAPRADRELAAFDRSFFETTLRDAVDSALTKSRAITNCDVPIGLTMTRQTPVELPVTGTVTARVQRFASVFTLQSGPATAGGRRALRITKPSETIAAAKSLGALALAPSLYSESSTDSERFHAMFEFVLASSSFPVAFAPRPIIYRPGGMRQRPDSAPRNEPSLFSDGGAFDNNPFALALRLYEIEAADNAGSVRVMYVNPNALRGTFATARVPAVAKGQQSGLGSTLQLAGGMYTAAGEYELQSLGRTIARDAELDSLSGNRLDSLDASGKHRASRQLKGVAKPTVLRSTRSAPIVGEHMQSFAAFLGRGFREYDFYTGVYDGVEFVARHFICANEPARTLDSCAQRSHQQLVTKNAFALSSLGNEVQLWHLRREFMPNNHTPSASPLTGAGAVDRNRLLLLSGIDAAMQPLALRPFELPCSGDLLRKQLCSTGFDGVLRTLKKDADVRRAARELLASCTANDDLRGRGGCTVDSAFKRLLDDPERQLNDVVEVALDNLWSAEKRLGSEGRQETELSSLVKAAHAYYRGENEGLRRGFEVNPSSARIGWTGWREKARSATAKILPNYVTLYGYAHANSAELPRSVNNARRVGGVALGWHPLVWYNSSPFDVVSAVEGYVFREERPSDNRGFEVTPGLLVRTRKFGGGVKEVGVFHAGHQYTIVTESGQKREAMLHVGVGYWGNRLQVSVRKLEHRPTTLNFGLGDVNGLIYWIAKGLW